jgi:carbon monoxide dehydrogenase subunit G
MVAIVERSIEISRGPDEVFSYVADRSHDPKWIDSVASVHREGAGALAVGSKLQATRRVGPRTVRYTEELLELDPPRTWTNRGYGGLPVTVLAKGRVEPLADGTRSRLTISTQFQGRGIGKLLVPLLARRLARQLPRDEQKLKELLEQGTQAQPN